MPGRKASARWTGVCALWLAGCSGRQSALDPAGDGAERIAGLFWWMTGGAILVWLAVMALAIYAMRTHAVGREGRRAKVLIIGGGAVVPTLLLAGLLAYGLAILPPLLARAPEGSLRIAVTGQQWWWSVRYQPPGGGEVTLANEIRLPVGEPVELTLDSLDVIHSFWIPALGGKMDMIPGRETRLMLRPTRTGTWRGVCAEYCGTSHAWMAFAVVVMEKDEFAEWLRGQAEPSAEPATALAAQGRELFLTNGCGACHAIRGTAADGVVGPDLTHVGSRLRIGADILPNDRESFRRWIAETGRIKPGVLMPHFGMLPRAELDAIAVYLESLQ